MFESSLKISKYIEDQIHSQIIDFFRLPYHFNKIRHIFFFIEAFLFLYPNYLRLKELFLEFNYGIAVV